MEEAPMSRPKRRVTAGLAIAVIGLSFTAVPASAEPAPQSCHGQTVASFAHAFGGARNAAEAFFGDNPHAVQTGQRFVRDFLCP
jgi:hypothetical protein